jgi:hypothetical protein
VTVSLRLPAATVALPFTAAPNEIHLAATS